MKRIDYPALIDEAMRGVVKKVLTLSSRQGLPGNHHFFVSFATGHAGVRISPQLKERYPEEMTIVLQHQFWDLQVHEDYFSVMLSFNNIPEKLVIPYAALTAFADPSIKFGLQFHAHGTTGDGLSEAVASLADYAQDNDEQMQAELMGEAAGGETMVMMEDPGIETSGGGAKVISLDAFRKK